MKKRGLHLTLEQADAHQRKHGFKPLIEKGKTLIEVFAAEEKAKKTKLRGKVREMNKTETEFSLMLEAQKRRGEILDWKFQGIRLGWGDCMVYKPDFTVISGLREMCKAKGIKPIKELDDAAEGAGWRSIKLIEVKGPHIHYVQQAVARFKGCRAEWKSCFEFELWQRDASKQWNRLL